MAWAILQFSELALGMAVEIGCLFLACALLYFLGPMRKRPGCRRQVDFRCALETAAPTEDAVARLVDDYLSMEALVSRPERAVELERCLEERGTSLPRRTYESLVLAQARGGRGAGVETARRMLQAGHSPSEEFCLQAMSLCAKSRNAPLAEALFKAEDRPSVAVYNAMIKVCGAAGEHDKACDVCEDLLGRGLAPDAATCEGIIKLAARAAGRPSLAEEVLKRAEGLSGAEVLLWTLHIAARQEDLAKVRSTFTRLQQELHAVVDSAAYNIVIDACCRHQDMLAARSYFDEMGRVGVSRTLTTFDTMIRGDSVLGDTAKVKGTINEMKRCGYVPKAASLTCLLECVAKSMDFEEVWRILREIEAQGFPIDSYIVSAMMQLARRSQSSQQAARALSILDRPGARACEDTIVFNLVLTACILWKDAQHLEKALRELRGASSKVEPTSRTYSLIIKASALLGRTEHAKEAWREMLARGMEPNSITVACIMDALVEGRRVEEAVSVFQDWRERVQYDAVVYSTLMKGFAAISDSDRAMSLHEDMQRSGVPSNQVVYTALISACARAGQMKRAEAAVSSMMADGWKPSTVTYSVIIHGYCVRGDILSAMAIFQNHFDNGVLAADCVLFNTLLRCCVRRSKWELAQSLLDMMTTQGVAPSNFTISIVVNMWSKKGLLNKAIDTVYEALRTPHGDQGPLVDAHVLNILLSACFRNRAPKRALEVFAEMKTWGIFASPSADAYSTMLVGLTRHGHVREAAALADEGCDALCAADRRKALAPSVLMQLFDGLRAEGLMAEVGAPLESKLGRTRVFLADG